MTEEVSVTVVSEITGEQAISITAPVKGGTPQSTITEDTSYTGSITWNPTVTGGKFAANTEYTANVTLTAKDGYQFASDVNPTVANATSVTDKKVAADGKTLTFKAAFPATGNKTLNGIDIITNPALTLAVPTAAPNDTATNERSLAVTGVYDDGSGGPVAVNWAITTAPVPTGVSLDGSTLKVTNDAEAGQVRIEASSTEGYTDAEFVTITKDASVESAIVLTAPASTTVAVPKSDTPNEIALPTAAVYDQYGKPMTGTFSITYAIDGTAPTGVTLAPGYGKIEVDRTAQAGEVKVRAKLGTTLTSDPVTYTITRETSQETSVSVIAPHYYMNVPKVTKPGTPNQAYQQFDPAKVLDQYGQEMTGKTVTWNVANDAGNPVTGVSIDNTGKLTVTNEAPAITVYVTATCLGIESNKSEVTINKDAAKDTFVEICDQVGDAPETSLSIPTGSIPRSVDYTAKVYDQYGKETTEMVNWTLDPATVTGVELDDTSIPGSATLKVDSTATPGTIKLIATCSTVGSTASKTLEITLANKAPASVTTAPAAKTGLEYNGTEQALLTAGVANGGTMKYSLGSSPWSTEIPTAKDAGTYSVQYKVVGDATHADSAPVTLPVTIGPKEVTVSSGITAENKVYDGGTSATINASGATITGKVDGDDLTINATGTFADADAGENKTVTLTLGTLGGTDSANYTLATAGNQTEAKANITVRDLTVKPNSGQSKSYGTTPDPVLTYTPTGAAPGETPAFDGALSRNPGEDVGTYNITKGSLALKNSGTFKATNYNLVLDTAVVTFEITKGTYGGATPTKTVNILKNYAGVQTGTLTAADFFTTAPAEAKITNAVPNFASSNMMSIAGADSSGNFTYDSKTNITAASDESWTITVSSKNYTDITATLTFSPVDKTDVSAQITFPNGTLTYNGAGQTYEKATTSTTAAGTPAWTYTYAPADATASLDSGLPKTAGTYTVTAKYEDDAHIGTKNATLTINKATPTGAPTCTKITTSGKTLADAGLTTAGSTLNPNAGTLEWVDDAGNVLPDTTAVAANTTYKWRFTPTDTNYETLTGSIELYHKSSSSGGGGSSHSSRYAITVDKTENGTITVSPKSASKGDTVTITVKPDKGYELDTLKVLDKDGDKVKITEKNGKYTFKMPSGKVTVKGSFVEEAPVQIFKDVPADAYYYEAVKWAAEKGITGGVGNGLFAPNQPCTRAQIVTFLWRAAGSPAPKNMSSFADVPADAFYAKAVAWAVENGITGGTGDGKFSPDATCTRAQSVTFLYRAAGSPKVSGSAEFGDVATNAYYADAVAWAAKNGITGGIGGGLFGSGNNCTRAQIVTFLYRAMK